jgi:energy-coupling factor transporter ATP-binding protein EcfA2
MSYELDLRTIRTPLLIALLRKEMCFPRLFMLKYRLTRVPPEERERRIGDLLRFARLDHTAHRRAEHLSGGMKKKLTLACALVYSPQVLFLDEPTTGVDPVSRRDFWLLLNDFLAQGMTLFVSTPYMDEAERFHHVALMHRGEIVACDTPTARTGYSTPPRCRRPPCAARCAHSIFARRPVCDVHRDGREQALIREQCLITVHGSPFADDYAHAYVGRPPQGNTRNSARPVHARHCAGAAAHHKALCAFAMNIIPDYVRAIAEAERVLVPGGRLVVLDVKMVSRNLPRWLHWMPHLCAVDLGHPTIAELRRAFAFAKRQRSHIAGNPVLGDVLRSHLFPRSLLDFE